MNLSISPVQSRNNFAPVKAKKFQNQNFASQRNFHISHNAAMAQKAAVMPAISFGSFKEIALAKQFDAILAKHSKGSNPLVLDAKHGFTTQMAHRIISEPNKPLIIGVTGQSASGKSTILAQAQKALGEGSYRIIHGDNYYNDTSQQRICEGGLVNMFKRGFSFDKPEAVELSKLSADLKRLSKGESIQRIEYNFANGGRTYTDKKIQPAPIIIVDSIFALNEKVKDNLDTGIYVQASPEKIKERFMRRALEERGKTPEEAVIQYADVTEKAQEHIVPTSKNAGLILSGEAALEQSQEFFNDIHRIFQ